MLKKNKTVEIIIMKRFFFYLLYCFLNPSFGTSNNFFPLLNVSDLYLHLVYIQSDTDYVEAPILVHFLSFYKKIVQAQIDSYQID